MKIHTLIGFAFALLVSGCDEETEYIPAAPYASGIRLQGKPVDTAFLYGSYKDPGAVFANNRDKDGRKDCHEQLLVSDVTGSVNTKLAGTYFLTYHAADSAGFPLPAVTRTVHVVENKASFLSGAYKVACTCTAVAKSSATPTVIMEEYSSVVAVGSSNNRFEILPFNVGPGKLVSGAQLDGSVINAGFWSSDYASISASGTLAASRNSFTIESTAYPFNPNAVFTCKNVYTRELVVENVLTEK